jgi:hypothetical protein
MIARVLAIACVAVAMPVSAFAQGLIKIDRQRQIARADLDYRTPATRSEEGMPIGNGRMGTLVWTSPSAVKLQINRVDLHAMDSTTFSFPRADSDYGYASAFVDIDLTQVGDEVFVEPFFGQHLSLYDGLMTLTGKGVVVRAVAWPNGDVMAFDIDDRRSHPEPINIDLRMLRYAAQYVPGQTAELARRHTVVVQTAAHTATSTLSMPQGRPTLVQQFREGDYYDSSAVSIRVGGDRQYRVRYVNDTTVQVALPPARGRVVVLIASAVSSKPDVDPAAAALEQLRLAELRNFDGLTRETAAWWQDFWSRGAVYMHSESGQADFVEANYNYFLYLMGASSRGDFPPRFGGMIWQTNGDMSRWGSQYWWANTSAYYNNLMPANRIELTDPMFRLYEGMRDAAALAARQQWGSEGIWIPETTFFNGPEKLPDDVATELRDMVLARKPFAARSPEFDRFAANKNRHNSRWNYRADGTWEYGSYVFTSKGTGIFGHTSHILGVAARIGMLAWERYRYSGDERWFREHGYPFIKGAAEFYRTFPNLEKDGTGVYHINHTNSGESDWNSRDAPYEVSCMHMIFPLAIRASAALGVDATLRPKWREVKDHLVAPPARARCGTGSEIADDRPFGAFVYRGPGAIDPIGAEPELKQRFLGFTALGSFIDAAGGGGAQIFRNRLRLREGPGAIDAEHIAGLSTGIHAAMLNSHAQSLTDDEPVVIFSGWPKDWDAAFSLLARGGFIVSAARLSGSVPLVEIQSPRGGRFVLSNPWGEQNVTVYRNGRKAETRSGRAIVLDTTASETIVVVPFGAVPRPVSVN